jgi:hypothetical protein
MTVYTLDVSDFLKLCGLGLYVARFIMTVRGHFLLPEGEHQRQKQARATKACK